MQTQVRDASPGSRQFFLAWSAAEVEEHWFFLNYHGLSVGWDEYLGWTVDLRKRMVERMIRQKEFEEKAVRGKG